jgi:hypothetical protein
MVSYDLTKLTFGRGIQIVFIFFGAVIAPLWFIFQFYPVLFASTDLIKLLLVCSAIGIPLCILNGLGYMVKMLSSNENLEEHETTLFLYRVMGIGGISAAVTLYIPCILTFFIKINAQEAIRIAIYIEVVPLLYTVVRLIAYRKKLDKLKHNQKDVTFQNVVDSKTPL